MVKNLKDLKVAEIRTELNNRDENSKGRKEGSNIYISFLISFLFAINFFFVEKP